MFNTNLATSTPQCRHYGDCNLDIRIHNTTKGSNSAVCLDGYGFKSRLSRGWAAIVLASAGLKDAIAALIL